MRLAVLVSGSGTNLQAILDARQSGRLGRAELVVVISNRPGVPALERARAAQVEALTLDHRSFPSREAFDEALLEALAARRVEWVALAGFMRLLGPAFLRRFPRRVVNIHPSLLPAFPGLHAQAQALAHGAKVAGCTVHLVEEEVDSGPILAQAAVEVRDDDDERSLTRRILEVEHRLYPQILRDLSLGELAFRDRRVSIILPPAAS